MIEVVIPTLNGARWIGQVFDYYQSISIDPLYVYDPRSTDATLDILQSKGARVVQFERTGQWLEDGMVEYLSAKSRFDWILRIDDDEAPSSGLLKWAQEHVVDSDQDVWSISRRELHLENGQVVYSRPLTQFHSESQRPGFLNAQDRLYNRKRVDFRANMHSCGFDFRKRDFVPQDHFLIHFSAIMRSCAERIGKLRTYEDAKPGSSWMFLWQYAPELMTDDFNRSVPLEAPEFDALLASIPRTSNKEMIDLSINELRAIKNSPMDAEAFFATINDYRAKNFAGWNTPKPRKKRSLKAIYLQYRAVLFAMIAAGIALAAFLMWQA